MSLHIKAEDVPHIFKNENENLSNLIPMLRTLKIDRFVIRHGYGDLDRIARLRNLKELRIELDGGGTDIKPLSNMTGLESLDLTRSDVISIMPLAGLAGLRSLTLTCVNVMNPEWKMRTLSDITPLSTLTNLRRLSLHGTRVEDVTPLSDMTDLLRLDLSRTLAYRVGPLANLRKLQDLDLNYVCVSDVSPLYNLTCMKKLCLLNTHVYEERVDFLRDTLRDTEVQHSLRYDAQWAEVLSDHYSIASAATV